MRTAFCRSFSISSCRLQEKATTIPLKSSLPAALNSLKETKKNDALKSKDRKLETAIGSYNGRGRRRLALGIDPGFLNCGFCVADMESRQIVFLATFSTVLQEQQLQQTTAQEVGVVSKGKTNNRKQPQSLNSGFIAQRILEIFHTLNKTFPVNDIQLYCVERQPFSPMFNQLAMARNVVVEGCIHTIILSAISHHIGSSSKSSTSSSSSPSTSIRSPEIVSMDPRAGNAFVKSMLETEENSGVREWIALKTRRITVDRSLKKAQVKLFMQAWMDGKVHGMNYSLSPEVKDMFESVKKKDDMADACFQLLSKIDGKS